MDTDVNLCKVEDISDGGMKHFEIMGYDILVVRLEGRFFCVDAACTYKWAMLTDGPTFSSSVEAVMTMADDKDQQFTRMWNEENKSKREKFRNLMKSKLDVLHVEVTEENARAFWNGRLAVRQPERLYQIPERSEERRPPRRR